MVVFCNRLSFQSLLSIVRNATNDLILLSVLAEFLDLGSGSTGSFALEAGQQAFFLKHVEQRANYIAEQITKQIVKNIVDYNFKDVDKYPTFTFSALGEIDSKKLAEIFEILACKAEARLQLIACLA